MPTSLNVVAICGSLQQPSRTRVLLDHVVDGLGRQLPLSVRWVELSVLGPQLGAALRRSQVGAEAEAALRAIESADLLVVGSPVYRASVTGLFKHLMDLVHHEALIDVPVLLAASGGSERHALVIDHQLRPLFSFFQARTLPLGVYASEADFQGHQIASPALTARIALAVARAVPWVQAGRSARVDEPAAALATA